MSDFKKIYFALIFAALLPALLISQENENGSEPAEEAAVETDAEEESTDFEQQRKDERNLIYKGEHHLNLGVGMTVPVLMDFYNNDSVGELGNGIVLGPDSYSPPVGLSGFFDYKFFIEGGWALGVELGGTFLSTTHHSQTLVHLGAEVTYLIRRWPVDIPISFSVGGHFNTLRRAAPEENITSGGIFLKPEIGFSYNINENWGIGASTSWWIVPEIYLPNETNDLSDQSAITHIWSFAITASYRFK